MFLISLFSSLLEIFFEKTKTKSKPKPGSLTSQLLFNINEICSNFLENFARLGTVVDMKWNKYISFNSPHTLKSRKEDKNSLQWSVVQTVFCLQEFHKPPCRIHTNIQNSFEKIPTINCFPMEHACDRPTTEQFRISSSLRREMLAL